VSAQWPLLYAQMLTVLPDLDGWDQVTVIDGPPLTAEVPSQYVTVGFIPNDDSAGSYQKTQHPNGFQYVEDGDIRSRLVVQSGDTDLDPHRCSFFDLMDSLEAYIRADRTFGGVLSPNSLLDLSTQVHPMQITKGSAQSGVFTLTYQTVT
jgi:hypothetical protein